MNKFSLLSIIALSLLACQPKTTVSEFELIGKISPRTTHQIESNNWTIGCEVLDRDYANYDDYKMYLDSLGCKTSRLQSGWAKTEKVKGEYNFLWLDTIIDDLLIRNIKPWVQLSYGNPIYKGGGGYSLGAGMPHTDEALQAWSKWVRASVERYKDKVSYWEIWNEGNLKGNNDPSTYGKLFILAAKNIREVQPDSRITTLALVDFGLDFTKSFFHYMDSLGKVDLIDEVTYHPYHPRPEEAYWGANELRKIIAQYSDKITIKQGENGAPSDGNTSGALSNLDWNEDRQAKWFLRRMLSDLGHDIPSSVFTIIEFNYPAGQHTVGWNMKGLLSADKTNGKVAYKKIAYSAVQNVTAIFDDQLKRIPELSFSIDTSEVDTSNLWFLREGSSFSVYGYENIESKKQLVVLWCGGKSTVEDVETFNVDISFPNLTINKPVMVDLFTGNIYEIPNSNCKKVSKGWSFKSLPINDFPIIITDKKLVIK